MQILLIRNFLNESVSCRGAVADPGSPSARFKSAIGHEFISLNFCFIEWFNLNVIEIRRAHCESEVVIDIVRQIAIPAFTNHNRRFMIEDSGVSILVACETVQTAECIRVIVLHSHHMIKECILNSLKLIPAKSFGRPTEASRFKHVNLFCFKLFKFCLISKSIR